MKNIGRDKNHTWYSRTSNRIDWKSVAPNSKLRQDLNKNNWTACFHMETNSTKIQCIENEEELFCVFFLFLNHSSTRSTFLSLLLEQGVHWRWVHNAFTEVGFWTSLWRSGYHVWTQKAVRELFPNGLHPNTHATISKTEHVQLLGFLHYPHKLCLCDTLNGYI